MTSYFLLAANDFDDASGFRVAAFDLAFSWIDRRVWPIYSGNRNRKSIGKGARIAFYLGGKGRNRQSFIGTALTSSVIQPSKEDVRQSGKFLMNSPEFMLELSEWEQFHKAVAIKPLIGQLSIVKTPGPKWGAGLVGGSRRMIEADFRLITQIARAEPTEPSP